MAFHLPKTILKALPSRPTVASTMGSQANGRIALEEQSWQKEHLENAAIHYLMYRINPWVRSCIDLIAQAATADMYTVAASSDTLRDALLVYLASLNPRMSFNRLLRGVYRDLQIDGNWYGRMTFVDGAPVSLYRVDFRRIVPRPPKEGGEIEEYTLFDVSRAYQYAGTQIPAQQILHLTLNDAGENGCGLAPMESLDYTLALDESARRFQQAYFQNGVKAGDVYSAENSIDPELIERDRQYLMDNHTSPTMAWAPLFLEGAWKLVRGGHDTKRDADFMNLKGWDREEVASVYSVPLTLLSTAIVGALGGNGKEQDAQLFREAVISPLQGQVMEDMTAQVVVGGLGNTEAKIEPPRGARIRMESAQTAEIMVQVGATGNQALAVLNLPPVEGMDVPLFLRRGGMMVGVPGSPDMVIITPTGAIKGEVQDPMELAAAHAPKGFPGEKAPGTASGGGKGDTPPDAERQDVQGDGEHGDS